MTSDFNPYQAPSIHIDAITSTRRLEPAGLGRRFGTVVVDNVGLMAIGGFVGAAIGLTLGEEALSFFGTAGWHDSIPKTRVVRHSDLQYDLGSRTPGR
jgi:hypothetical protein